MIENLESKLNGLEPIDRGELIKLISSWGRNDESECNDEIIYECEPAECYPFQKDKTLNVLSNRVLHLATKLLVVENLDVSQIENLSYVFAESNYNGDLSNWDVSNCKNMNDMFSFSDFNNDSLNFWNISNVETMQYMFYYSNFSGDVSSWQFNKNIDFDFIFDGNDKFIEKYNSNKDINYDSNSFLKWFEENREKMKEINNGSKDEILDFFSFNNDLNIEKEKL